MNVISIVGARPQFVKLAPISWSSKNQFNHGILHTGQHYDPLLSDSFFETLNIPAPDYQLNIGSGSHGEQTGRMIIEIEAIFVANQPDHVIVYGDTNSTLAGAIASTKLNIPISHVEAGLRSFNRSMPEETNRIITDHCSNFLFAPTKTALNNLRIEGLADHSIHSGDVMVEALAYVQKKSQTNRINQDDYIFATIHRAENTDNPARISQIISKMRTSQKTILLHCHPRLKKVLQDLGLYKDSKILKFLPPLDYISTINTVKNSLGVITDSGGLQKEAYILNKSCLVVRNESEWIETIEDGSNFLDPNLDEIEYNWWDRKPIQITDNNVFGDGNASRIIVKQILESFSK